MVKSIKKSSSSSLITNTDCTYANISMYTGITVSIIIAIFILSSLNNLEHNLEVNTRSSKVLYAVLCGYVLIKTFKWLINK